MIAGQNDELGTGQSDGSLGRSWLIPALSAGFCPFWRRFFTAAALVYSDASS
jgi:hypothetical protein